MDEKGLGKQLQEARQAAGMTQQQLCHAANLSFSTLTKIERGAIKAPSIFTVQAIGNALGLGLDELMGTSSARHHRDLKKTKSGASFIYFDVNGCLVRFYQRAFTKLATDTGAPADSIETAYWHYNDEVCRGTVSLSDFNQELAKITGVKDVNWQHYYLEAVEPVEAMHEVIKWAAENYRIGLLSDTMPGFLAGLKQNGKLPSLAYDAVIDSSEVGLLKPEQAIFELAQQKAGVPAEEILFIDDDRANLMAGEKLGWRVVLFDDAQPEESAARVRQALEPAA